MPGPTKSEGSGRFHSAQDEGARKAGVRVETRSLISIVLCTRNRAAKLKQALQSILALKLPPGGDYEVIVANNGSTDDTSQVCSGMEPSFNGRLHVTFVPEPGKSGAANAGINLARGEIIAFIDDDIYPQSDWLEVIGREFSHDPDLQLLCGRVELFNPADLPITIRRQKDRIAFQTVSDSFNLTVGCNCAVRRQLFDRVGCFDRDLGPGTRFESAEDADFFFRAWRSGARIVYEPSLFVFHDHGRRTQEDRWSIRRSYAVGRGAFYAKHLLKNKLLILRAMAGELEWGLKMFVRREGDKGWQFIWLSKGFARFCWRRTARLFSPARNANPAGIPK